MGRFYNFDIKFGKIVLEKNKEELSPLYASAWRMLTSTDLDYEPWVLIFNILGPALVTEINKLSPHTAQKMITAYQVTLGADDPDVIHIESLEDEASKFTYIIRAKFEATLRAALLAGPNSQNIIDAYLGELKEIFGKVPKYCITAVHETLSIYAGGS